MSQSEYFLSHGLAREPKLVDFITGETVKYYPGSDRTVDCLAGFAANINAAKRLVAMFNGLASFRYWDRQKTRTLVFIGASEESIGGLKALHDYTKAHNNQLVPGMIALARQRSTSYTPAREIVRMLGVGMDSGSVDFVTGAPLSGMVPNMLMQVSEKGHENVKCIFNDRIGHKNGYINVATSHENRAAIEELHRLVRESGNLLTQEIVAQARGVVTKTEKKLMVA